MSDQLPPPPPPPSDPVPSNSVSSDPVSSDPVSSDPVSSNPPAGWYPDPQGLTRWWDGTAWGEAAPAPAFGAGAVPSSAPGSMSPATIPLQGYAGTAGEDQTGTASLAHWLGAIGFVFPCFGWIGPLAIYASAKPEQTFVRHHAAEELNFQITLVIGYVVSFVLMFVCVGFFTFLVVWVLNLVYPIIAAMKAKNGEWYRYPMNIRMVSGALG